MYLYAENAPGCHRHMSNAQQPQKEGTYQHADIPEQTLSRLVEDVADLVLKILRSNCSARVHQLPVD